MDKEKLSQCRNDKELNRDELMLHPDVVGVGLGSREREGKPTNEAAVKVYVRKKIRDKSQLGDRLLPKSVGKSDVDVVEMAPLRAYGSFRRRLRPVLGGASGAVEVPGLNYTGTLGMAVRGYGAYAGRFFLLSNNHVLANINEANIGDPVIQPGRLDGGNPSTDTVGHLFDYVPLKFDVPGVERRVNRVDAALAEIDFGVASREIFWVGYPKGWRGKIALQNALAEAGGELTVQKTGRTTAYTVGEVADLAYDGWVNYAQGRVAYFEDQILIRPGSFSDAGDSGSIILDMNERIVGLLFAGGATHTIANHIEDVWLELPALEFSDFHG